MLHQSDWSQEDQQRAKSPAAPPMWRWLEWVSSGSRPYYYPAEGPLGDYSLLPQPWAVEPR